MATATFGQACRGVNCSRNQCSARPTACKASGAEHSNRRRALLIGATVPVALATAQRSDALEKSELPVSQLSLQDRAEQKAEVVSRASMELKKVLTPDDKVKALRLVLNDAATYDMATKTGGMDGSIVLNKAEAARPENAGLSDYVAKLAKAKEAIDAGNAELGSGPMSWADLMAIGVRTTQEAEWKRIKVGRAAIPSGGETIVKTFGSEWPIRLGRIDSSAEEGQRALGPGASTTEMNTFFNALGAKGDTGFFAAKPPFWEKYSFLLYSAAQDDPQAYEEMLAAENEEFAKWKLDYDRSRKTVTRTNYEVDFITAFTKLTVLGAKVDPDAYLHPRVTYKYG